MTSSERRKAQRALEESRQALERAKESKKETSKLVGRLRLENDEFAAIITRLFAGEPPEQRGEAQ